MIRSFIARILQGSPLARFILLAMLFLVFLLAMVGILRITQRSPVLISINPAIGDPGAVVVLQGKHFGNAQSDGWIEISGNRISANCYINWTDTTIMAVLPVTVEDGLVYICRGTRRSNPLIYANLKNIPISTRPVEDTGTPSITRFSADKVEIGKLLVIQGRNFGLTRGNSEVLFSWQIDPAVPMADAQIEQLSVACSEQDFDYEFWSDQELRVRVPDGTAPGNVFVKTSRGMSNAMPVQVVNQPGTKLFSGSRTYVLSLQVDVTGVQAAEGNMLFIRIPLPDTTPSQRNVEVTSSEPPPYMDNYRGTILHQMENLKTGKNERISHTFLMNKYGIATSIIPAQVKPYSEVKSPLYLMYTSPDGIVPSDKAEIVLKAAALTGSEKNPYLKARKIYDWLTESFAYSEIDDKNRTIAEALASESGSAYDMAILFCALSRASGIPSVPIAGIVVDPDRKSRVHWWAEFYLENFGWVPVDPGLGIGKPFPMRGDDEARSWYFGNLDPHHIVFSRGWTDQNAMTPKSRVVYRPRSWAFQPIWEESAGNIKGYASLWGDPVVTGLY